MIRFNDIIGQEPIKKHLQTALAQNNVSHVTRLFRMFIPDRKLRRFRFRTAYPGKSLCQSIVV